MISEIFKPIPDCYPYQISNHGRLKRNDRILSTPTGPNGYKRKNLKDLKQNILIHRAVALCFLPNPNNLPCVNHKDRNRKNNDLSNLEWITHQGNMQHSAPKLEVEHIPIIKDAINAGFSQRKIARYFKVSQSMVSFINNSINWVSK